MSQTMRLDLLLRLDPADVLGSVVRMLRHYESGGHLAEQDAATKLLRELSRYADDLGVDDVAFVSDPERAEVLLEAVRDDAAGGYFGTLPPAIETTLMRPFG